MRQSFNNSLIVENEKVIAVSLGSDYCAEHEWGVHKLEDMFGFGDQNKFGLNRRKITRLNSITWYDGKADFYPAKGRKTKKKCGGFWVKPVDAFPKSALFLDTNSLWTAWSDGEFACLSIDPVQISNLKEIYDSIKRLDAAIWLGGGGPFKNAGLAIAVASRLSADVIDMWDKHDREAAKLEADADRTGIKDRLDKAGKHFYALSPRREEDGSIKFFLNPCAQDKNNHGWFTVQDLDDWILGKGKIPKS